MWETVGVSELGMGMMPRNFRGVVPPGTALCVALGVLARLPSIVTERIRNTGQHRRFKAFAEGRLVAALVNR